MRGLAVALSLGLGLGLSLGLAGCVVTQTPPGDACGASGMQGLVGQSGDVLAAMTFPVGTRVITPGMAVTEDYSEARLNIDLDDQGRVARVWCG